MKFKMRGKYFGSMKKGDECDSFDQRERDTQLERPKRIAEQSVDEGRRSIDQSRGRIFRTKIRE